MLLFGIVLDSSSFWWEAKKAKRLIIDKFSKGNVCEQHTTPELAVR